jgi:hypothetical protein
MTMRRAEPLYYLPPGYWVERSHALLVLRRPNGSMIDTFVGQQTIGEIVERYAWEDSAKRESRLARKCERVLDLPVSVVLGMLWLLGLISMGLCAVALYSLWSLL